MRTRTPSPRRARALAAALAIALPVQAGCGGSPSGPPPPPAMSVRFTPAASPAPPNSISLQQGSAGATTLTVSVTATGVPTVASVFFDLTWNPAVLRYRSAAIGPFLGTSGGSATLTVPTDPDLLAQVNATGRLPVSANVLPAVVGAAGSGVIASITFESVASGSSALSFEAFGARTPFPSLPIAGVTWSGGSVAVTR